MWAVSDWVVLSGGFGLWQAQKPWHGVGVAAGGDGETLAVKATAATMSLRTGLKLVQLAAIMHLSEESPGAPRGSALFPQGRLASSLVFVKC